MRRHEMLSRFEERVTVGAARGRGPVPELTSAPEKIVDAQCRICELETENARLRLLVGELLVSNQRLREIAGTVHPQEPAA
jgi:hypothetical protein